MALRKFSESKERMSDRHFSYRNFFLVALREYYFGLKIQDSFFKLQ
jgi:hypothetical protein